MKAIISVLLLTALAANVHAATHRHPTNGHSRAHADCSQPDDLASRLQLSSAQTEKLKNLMDKHRTAMDKLRDQHEKKHREDREEMQKLWASQHKDVAALLTSSQLETFEQLEKKRPHPMRDRDDKAERDAMPLKGE